MKYLSTLILAFGLVSFAACSDDDDPVNPQPEEFVAADADFANYRNWAQPIEPQKGKDPAGIIGDAHGADDENMTRHIFINNNNVVRDGNGNFPVGTRLVKEVRMGDGSVAMVTAMVKRGGTFNESNRNWEWMLLSEDGKIMDRDANLMDNMCNGCHSTNANEDYVFTK
ncbi:MAG: cytochrome P460 family protein [Bacteroidota bacterium]|nr:cytochrome P460 family protein [Bacteroidota bacterium]